MSEEVGHGVTTHDNEVKVTGPTYPQPRGKMETCVHLHGERVQINGEICRDICTLLACKVSIFCGGIAALGCCAPSGKINTAVSYLL